MTMQRILFALLLFCLPGCVTGPDGRKQPSPILTLIAERGAEYGARAWLKSHPADQVKFDLAVEALKSLLARDQFKAEDMGAVLQTLPINLFQGVEGQLLVSDVVVIWDAVAESATRIDKTSWLKPIASAIVRGLSRGKLAQAPPLPAGILASDIRTAPPPPVAARFAPASAPSPVVLVDPFILDEGPPWGKNLWMTARQGPNTELLVGWALTPDATDWRVLADFTCWPDEQSFFVVMKGDFPAAFVRGQNLPCPTDAAFRPAGAPPALGATRKVKTPRGEALIAEVVGVDTSTGVRVFKRLP